MNGREQAEETNCEPHDSRTPGSGPDWLRTDAEWLREALGPDRRRGLRLLAIDKDGLRLGKRLREDDSLAELIGEAQADAARMLDETEPVLTEELFGLFDKTGERLPYERVYFEKRKRLSAFAIMSLLYPETELYRERLLQTAWSVCEERTWCLPAHYDKRRGPLGSIDLFAAETGFALAELAAMMGESLPDALKNRIAAEIERRLFRPFLEKGPYHWERLENNWSAVCAGSIGAAALYQLEDRDRLAVLLKRVFGAMDHFLAGYGDDGACVEGYQYWQYGFGYYVYFAALLKEATDGKLDGFASAKVREIAMFQQRCFSGGEMIVNFSDATPHSSIFMGLTWRLHDEFPAVALPHPSLRAPYSDDHCGRWAPAVRNLIWAANKTGRVEMTAAPAWPAEARYMADAQWLISRHIASNGSSYCFAAKGGHNAESHNHNDCGHFILHADGEAYLADLGRGLYTKQYFGPERYSFWCNGSQGHSVPLIGGTLQKDGAACRATVTDVSLAAEEDRFALELGAAYPDAPGLLRLERRFRWSKQGEPGLALHDKAVFEADAGHGDEALPGAALTERFITQMEPRLDREAGRVTLTGKRSLTIVYDAESWTPEAAECSDLDHDGRERRWYTLDFHRLPDMPKSHTIEAVFHFQFSESQR